MTIVLSISVLSFLAIILYYFKNITFGDLLNKGTSEHKVSLIHFLGCPYVILRKDVFVIFD